jgi:transcriptional regulator with XRE-family HTH domain
MASQRVKMKKLQKELGLKIEVLAALSGVSAGTVSRVLAGKRTASAELTNKIESTLRSIERVRQGFAMAPLDLTDVKWLRGKIKEFGDVAQERE